MDCNKEEANRAKGIAEKKMENKDFVGARKIALRAQQLYPDLENISQMLTVCEVHCSAEHRALGSEMDWYGILQVEKTADETSIKKQYRKLALLLHPDKNSFAGAEAAFKLVGEAQRVLTDRGKRTIYDMKCKNSCFKKPPVVQNNFVNTSSTRFMGFNPHQQQQQQQTQPGFSNGQQTFWTMCPFCDIKYQYYRDCVNRALRCHKCKQPFIAHDLEAQGMASGANRSRSAFPQQKELPNHVDPKVGSGAKASVSSPKTGKTSDVGGRSKTKGKREDVEVRKDGENKPKFTIRKPNEGKASENTSRKRGRKSEESSSDDGTESSTDDEKTEVLGEDGGSRAGQSTGSAAERNCRRSSRLKQQVIYDENLSDDDDFVSPPKRSKVSKSSNATVERSNEASLKRETSTYKPSSSTKEHKKEEKQEGRGDPLEETLPNGNVEARKFKTNETEGGVSMEENVGRSKVTDDSQSNLGSKIKPDPEFVAYPDPDFNDFSKDRKEEYFGVDQIWAIYDNLDSMPRFYARIRKVFSPGFKLRITWLEPDPDSQAELDWFKEDLPVSCGRFKLGNSEDTEDLLMFSHSISWEKGTGRGSYKIYPRKGETWALFKNWDIRWSSDPDNHREYEFEFGEVLSDYKEGLGIQIAYLVKVKGFVSLFKQTVKYGTHSFLVPPNELLRFSHRVPSFVMTGLERKNVPEGSFELDPASLPDKELSNPEDVNVNSERVGSKHVGSTKFQDEEVKPMTEDKGSNMPKKRIDPDGGVLKSGNLSTRELNAEKIDSKHGVSTKFQAEEVKPMTGDKRSNTPKKRKHPDEKKKTQDEGILKSGNLSTRELNAEKIDSKHGGSTTFQAEEVKPMTGDKKSNTPKKRKDPDEKKNTQDEGILKSGNSSTRELNGNPKKKLSQTNEETCGDKVAEFHSTSPPSEEAHEIPEPQFYSFDADRSQEKFQPGQIWALYSDEDGFPKYYARINKIESPPDFKLHITWFEACPAPKSIQWSDKDMPVSCGTFKLASSSRMVYSSVSSFSHQLSIESLSRNKYEIYPRKGEVWALYKHFDSKWSCSDLAKCEHEMVEILEDDNSTTKVLVLAQVDGFKTVFRAQRTGGSAVTMEIPRVESLRFSHRVPAFRLMRERKGSLRGCWELDPASMPVLFFSS